MIVILLTVQSSLVAAQGSILLPPPQPHDGSGGSAYAFESINAYRAGDVPTGAWVFAPDGFSGTDRARLPVVLFLHGFGASGPETYHGWIAHLVKRGATVIYPDYQDPGFLVFNQLEFMANMISGIGQGLASAGLEPDAIHVVGHSLGGVLGTAYLSAGAAAGLPPVGTLTVVAPGGCSTCGATSAFGIPLPIELNPPDALLVNIVAGADDTIVGAGDAFAIRDLLRDVPIDQRRMVIVPSDRYGSPSLIADHLFPQTAGFGGEADALDWYGLWRPLDSLITCYEQGSLCDVSLGDTASDLFMGNWSDGTPVKLPAPVTATHRVSIELELTKCLR